MKDNLFLLIDAWGQNEHKLKLEVGKNVYLRVDKENKRIIGYTNRKYAEQDRKIFSWGRIENDLKTIQDHSGNLPVQIATGENLYEMVESGQIVEAKVFMGTNKKKEGEEVRYLILSVDTNQSKITTEAIENKTWEWAVKGGTTSHAAKISVIERFNENKNVEVQIELVDNEVQLTIPGEEFDEEGKIRTAGTIDSITEEEFQELASVLKQVKKITGHVTRTKGITYYLSVSTLREELEAAKNGEVIETVEFLKEKIIKEIGSEKETLDEIEDYLKAQRIPTVNIKEVFRMHRQYPEEVMSLIPEKPKTPYIDRDGLFADSIEYILGGDSQLLEGDASVGKNVLVQTMAWILQKPYYIISMNSQIDKYDLTGSPTAKMELDENGNGVSVIRFNPSGLIRMMECGGMVLLDELNAANPAVVTILHNIAEKGQKSIDLEGYGHVKASKDFILYGAFNPGFEGTVELNEAFDSRFPTLDFGKNTSIIDLLRIHDESKATPESILMTIDKVYRKLYLLASEENIIDAKVLAFRRFASAAYYAGRPNFGLKKALIQNVANKASDEGQKNTIKEIINNYIV